MFRDFLWLLHAKQSHDMQKANGLAGFLAILFIILLMFKWNDWFAPIFYALQLDRIPALLNADHGDFYALTFIHMMAWVLLICFVLSLLALVVYVLFFTPVVFIFIAPILLVALIFVAIKDFFMNLFSPKQNETADSAESVDVNPHEVMVNKLTSLIEAGAAKELDSKETTKYLNKAMPPTAGQPWMIAKDSQNNWFLLANNPLPVHVSSAYSPNSTGNFTTLRNIYIENKATRQLLGLSAANDPWEHIAGTRQVDSFFTTDYSQYDNLSVTTSLNVLSIPLEVRLDSSDVPYFHFEAASEVVLQEELINLVKYQVETEEIHSLYKSVELEHSKFVEAIHQQHVAFYAYPYFSEVEYNYMNEGGLSFLKAYEGVTNAREYNHIYHPHVFALALEEAHNFKSKWAVNYLETYQS